MNKKLFNTPDTTLSPALFWFFSLYSTLETEKSIIMTSKP